MSRPPKLTKLKPEENQPPLEAYVIDLITTPTPTTSIIEENSVVMPANIDKFGTVTGVTATQVKDSVGDSVQCQKPREETKQRHRC